ncbi:MAG: diguanylate cyclase [Hydrogenovibrio sp.]|uniref:GGDEF domain-containing protein n=1 Tax=Hydrogenovibrio sp. TaxID=2065821 RepID=UPI00287058FD|nr:diguanylate cyclase [Hydrogenovibrio sp.]MDR9500128.1 diguanylate cyclase [Hydrogenovibrio sp.]
MSTHQTKPFIDYLLRRIVFMVLISLPLAAVVTMISGYFLSKDVFDDHISKQKRIVQEDIQNRLMAGWIPKDLEAILLDLNKHQSISHYYFMPENDFAKSHSDLLSQSLKNTLKSIQHSGTAVYELQISKHNVTGGFPIHLEPHCIQCHPGKNVGDYAGAVLFESHLEPLLLNWTNVLTFLGVFMLTFIGVGSYIMIRILRNDVVTPLCQLSDRIFHLRLQDTDVQWQRDPKQILEIDRIDEYLHHNIKELKNVHDKLEALFVTEHESGFFHETRFKETMQYEMFRAKRYQRRFSILIIKLLKIVPLDHTQKASTAERIHLFSQLIRHEIRDSDIPFRVGKQLFIVITPETDETCIPSMAKSFEEKFRPSEEEAAETGYRFEVSVGYATYEYDAKTAKELSKVALMRMNHPEEEIDFDGKEVQ